MKKKTILLPSAHRRAFVLPLAFALAGAVQAADRYWDGTSGSWATLSNWSTEPNATTPDPLTVPGGGDAVFFNISSGNGNTVIDLNANRNTEGLTFNNTGTTGFRGNTSGTTARLLTINPGGILMNPDAGVVTFGAGNGAVNLSFSSSQSITNNSSSNLNINGTVAGSGSPVITNNGSGTGYVGMGALQSTVGRIVQDSATSPLGLRANSSGFTGTVEILKGTVLIGTSANNLGTSAGQVLLGGSGTDAATLDINDNSSQTYTAKPIVLGTTSGLLTIRLRDDSGTNTHTIQGAISGTNNLTLETNGGDDRLTFNTGGFNNTGTITHIGTGSGDLTINSVIGSNVTGVVQNSATSRMVLNGANTYSGITNIVGGTLIAGSTGAIANSPVNLAGGTLASTLNGTVTTTGTLSLSGGVTSRIDFGGGTTVLSFADSSSAIWTAGSTLEIWNWTGNLGGGGADQLIFASAGLDSTRIAQVTFVDPNGISGNFGAQFVGNELVPVPEPSPLMVGLGLLGMALSRRSRV